MTLSAADILVGIADRAAFFRDADGDTAYARFTVHTHCETWPVRSRAFKRWLIGQYYSALQKSPGSQAVADAMAVLEARAQYDSPIQRVHVRVAGDGDAIYLDLANARWEAVKVTATGWTVVGDVPVRFRRARGMLPLLAPTPGGELGMLRAFVNIESAEQWALLAAWLVAALRPTGPYPVLALLGEQGTAKSTTQKVCRALIDPNVAPLRAEPMDVRDVMIAARNGWCLAYDNLSNIEAWLSDCLCRLATGGGFSTRELYSDDDEMLFVAQRPVMVNGIDAVIERADLLDRALILDLPRIPDAQRRQETALWAQFDAHQPAMLGALLDAVVTALQRHADVRLSTLPRMADFAAWVVAAEPALAVPAGAFLEAYSGNRAAAHDLALEASCVAAPVRALVGTADWSGTAAELLEALAKITDDITMKSRGWPTSPRALGSALRRIAPNLRAVGVAVEFSDQRERGAKRRQIAIQKAPVPADQKGEALDRSDRSDAGSGDPSSFPGNDGAFPRNDELLTRSAGGNGGSPVGAARNDGNGVAPSFSGPEVHNAEEAEL